MKRSHYACPALSDLSDCYRVWAHQGFVRTHVLVQKKHKRSVNWEYTLKLAATVSPKTWHAYVKFEN